MTLDVAGFIGTQIPLCQVWPESSDVESPEFPMHLTVQEPRKSGVGALMVLVTAHAWQISPC